MKNLKLLFFTFLAVFSLLTYSCKDSCEDVFCESLGTAVDNSCVDGQCKCEIENFGTLQFSIQCTNCTASNTISADLLIDGITVGNALNISNTNAKAFHYNSYPSGIKSYKIVSSGIVRDSGMLEIRNCEVTYLTSQVTK